MTKPRILDLFCGAGGCTKGYQEAGFYVVGVDLKPQPNYCGDEFYREDAIALLESGAAWVPDGDWHVALPVESVFDAIHASPPCQAYTVYGNNKEHVRDGHPELIEPVRELLRAAGLPYVIENVPGAPLRDPIQLCGTSFPPLEVRRHRLFESNLPLMALPCNHGRLTERKYPGSSNRPNGRTVCNIGEWRVPLGQQQKAIGIDWMSVPELSQAIPPAYTRFIGEQLLAHLQAEQAAA
jgi:DNA (cytosine-5)-methyltransferase 1